MQIAVVYSSNIAAAWCLSDGIINTLRKMGHLVLDVPQSGYLLNCTDWWKRVEEYNQADLFILSGADYAFWQRSYSGTRTTFCVPDIDATLAAIHPPKFALYFESIGMYPDVTTKLTQMRTLFNHNFYPAVQDALEFDRTLPNRCHFFPFSADTDLFFPQGIARPFRLAFIGSIYPKRQEFLNEYYKIAPSSDWCPMIGHATVEDVEGVNILESTRRLAYNYNRIQALVALPTMAQEMVTKVFEAMACGCCVLAPRLKEGAANMLGFEHGKDLLFYDPTPEGLLAAVRVVLENPTLVQDIGFNASVKAMREHSLKGRMAFLLSKVSL